MGSFPPASFLNWEYYENRQRQIRENRDPQTVQVILNNQSLGTAFDSRRRRRLRVRELMQPPFGTLFDVVKGDYADPDADPGLRTLAR